MKICGYCGKANVNALLFCAECGTALNVSHEALTRSPPTSVRVLNARSATIILSAYLAVQLFCGLVAAVIANVMAAAYGIHNLRQVNIILDVLTPAIVIPTLMLGGIVIVLTSHALIPNHLKDTSSKGAAWVPGSWRATVVALAIGLTVGVCAHVLSILKPHVTYSELGPLARMALTPGMPQTTWVVAALLLGPPVEEMLCRGVLYGGYRKSFGRVWAAVFTTLLFVMWHIPEYIHFWPGIIGAGRVALGALWCRLRWNAISPAIAVHVGCNAVSAIIVFLRH